MPNQTVTLLDMACRDLSKAKNPDLWSSLAALQRAAAEARAGIQAALRSMTDQALADHYRVSVSTIRRWQFCDDVQDRPHTRHNLLATLTPAQEEILIASKVWFRRGSGANAKMVRLAL